MLAQTSIQTEFPLVEELRKKIREAGLLPAADSEIRSISSILEDSIHNNVLDDYRVDPETFALDALFREERLRRVDVVRFYALWIDMKSGRDER